MEWNRKTVQTILGIATFCIFLAWILKNIQFAGAVIGVLLRFASPFLMGGAIAFILNIPMKGIERRLFPRAQRPAVQKLRRPFAISLTLLAVASVLALIVLLVVPELVETIRILADSIPHFFYEAQTWVIEVFGANAALVDWLSTLSLDWEKILDSVINWLQNGAGDVVSGTVGAASTIVSGIVNFCVGFVFAIYALAQREKLSRQAKMLCYAWLPEKRADVLCRVGALATRTFSNFLSGQCLEACILGTLFVVAMTIFKMPYALLIGVLITFTALIPIFGAFIGCVVGAFLILMQNPMQAVWFVVLFIVLQQLEGNLIYPKVVGNSVGLPSIWVLVAVTIGGSTMGVFGMLVMIPVCSVGYSLLRETVHHRLERRQVPREKVTVKEQPVPEKPTPVTRTKRKKSWDNKKEEER